MRVLVVGGGSAGHVLPAVAVIEHLQAAGHEVRFVGTRSGLEARLLENVAVRFHAVAAGKLRRYWSWRNFTDVLKVIAGFVEASALLLRWRPHVVFSKGGYVALPVVIAAWCQRIPVVAHESDLTPGLANRLSLPFLRTLCVSFAETLPYVTRKGLELRHTGTPLREEILNGDAARGRAALGVAQDQPILLITGGSLGADILNHVVREALPELLDAYLVVHVCGPGKALSIAPDPRYVQREYVTSGWGDLIAAADIVVSRAGANVLFELFALGKVNVLVPLSRDASRGDQIENASLAQAAGRSVVVEEAALDAGTLIAAVQAAQANATSMREALEAFETPDAARAIAAAIEEHA